MVRKSLALLAALLALVFFGSVMCPPVDERGEPPSVTVGDADTLPGRPEAGQLEGPLRDTEPAPPPADEPTAQPLHVPVTDDQGAPLDGALVDLERVSGTRAVARALSRAGTAAFLPPGPGEYQLHATAEGHVPVRGVPLTLPLDEGQAPPTLLLPRAASITGTVVGLDGEPVVFGELLLREADGEERTVRARGLGVFDSGPLPAGEWEILWREHVHAEVDPRLRFHAALGSDSALRLAFTVEAAGRIAAPGRQVGVVEEAP